MEHKGELHPQIVDRGRHAARSSSAYFIPERANLEVPDGQKVAAGTLLAKTPREVAAARRTSPAVCRASRKSSKPAGRATRPSWPRCPARSASATRSAASGIIWVQPEDDDGKSIGEEREHQVPAGKQLRVHTGDYVEGGDPLVFGPLVPHDILAHLGHRGRAGLPGPRGADASTARQRVEIDDKHIEIIVAQMLRKVKVDEHRATPTSCPAR